MTKKELLIRDYQGKLPLPGEIEVGWRFTDDAGVTVDLMWGQIGRGKSKEDQERRLMRIVSELRTQQKAQGNSDFTIADQRKQ